MKKYLAILAIGLLAVPGGWNNVRPSLFPPQAWG